MCVYVYYDVIMESDWKYVNFLRGRIIFKTVSVKDNRDTVINVRLQERKKGSEE